MSEQQTQATDVADEQAADLAKLRAQVQATAPVPGVRSTEPEGEQDDDEDGELPPPSPQAMQMAHMVLTTVKPLLCFAVPALQEAPEEYWDPVPVGLGAVFDEVGVSPKWMRSPWARLAMSLVPLASFVAIKSLDKPKKPEPMALEAAPPAEPVGQKTVTFGAPAAEAAPA